MHGDLLMKRCLVLLLALACALPAHAAKKSSYFRIGNPADTATATERGIVLMGGSTDVDAAFQWLCARGGNGDFLVVRATGTDAYNPYIQELCPGINSVATLIIPSLTAANEASVASTIRAAEVIWIAGGDQSNYIKYWKGTPVQAAINARLADGVPIGGTSAGFNVLTQFIYSALASKGVTSSQALADPFNRYVSLDRDFVNLPILQGIIGDPHFVPRDRMGRDLAFMCRIATSGWAAMPRGISVDERTALLIDGAQGTVVGDSTVYFLQAPGAPEVCANKTPLTYLNIDVYRIGAASGSFDLANWTGTGGSAYEVSADAGVLTSTQAGASPY
jgi:cyanophycinase